MSTYKVIEVVGTSASSWEDAAKSAVKEASKSLRDMRIAEVTAFDATLDDQGNISLFRSKLKLSFKHEVG